MNGWAAKDSALLASNSIGASQSNVPVTKEFAIYSGGATEGMVVEVVVTAVTDTTGITAKLQTGIGSRWVDVKSVAIEATGSVYIRVINPQDEAVMPLLNKGRVVVSTGTGDSVTISEVNVLQQL